MDKFASVAANSTVQTVFTNGCATGVGRLVSENAWLPFTIIIVLLAIWYYRVEWLRPIPILGPRLFPEPEPDAANPSVPESK